MSRINWKVRFNRENRAFILRFVLALVLPILTYLGLKFEDLTTWQGVGQVVVQFMSNPFLVGLTFINACNMIPDPTTSGLGDSQRALGYDKPNHNT